MNHREEQDAARQRKSEAKANNIKAAQERDAKAKLLRRQRRHSITKESLLNILKSHGIVNESDEKIVCIWTDMDAYTIITLAKD